MRDFIPEGEDSSAPTGKGGYRDFVPQEEIDEKRASNAVRRAELKEEAKGNKKVSKAKNSKKDKKAKEVKVKQPKEEVKVVEEEVVEKPKRGKKNNLKV